MKNIRIRPHLTAALAALGLLVGTAHAQYTTQSITLQPGWTAFYLRVMPVETANQVFSNWPVSKVFLCVDTTFLYNQQFTTDANVEPIPSKNYLSCWPNQSMSEFHNLLGNTVYLAFSTNSTEVTRTVTGVPVVPKTVWRKSSADGQEPYNLVGFLLDPEDNGGVT